MAALAPRSQGRRSPRNGRDARRKTARRFGPAAAVAPGSDSPRAPTPASPCAPPGARRDRPASGRRRPGSGPRACWLAPAHRPAPSCGRPLPARVRMAAAHSAAGGRTPDGNGKTASAWRPALAPGSGCRSRRRLAHVGIRPASGVLTVATVVAGQPRRRQPVAVRAPLPDAHWVNSDQCPNRTSVEWIPRRWTL